MPNDWRPPVRWSAAVRHHGADLGSTLRAPNGGTLPLADRVSKVRPDGTGIIDWSEAGQGAALFDLATLTLGHEEHLGDVVTGYGADVGPDVIRAWWSLRSLLGVRWLVEHGFDPTAPGCEVDVRSPDVRLRGPHCCECVLTRRAGDLCAYPLSTLN